MGVFMNTPADRRSPDGKNDGGNGSERESKQKKIRVFISINLPDHVACWLSEVQEELKTCRLPVQWTRTGNIHLTLKFLGEIASQNVASVCQVVEESIGNLLPMEIFAQGVGVFPGVKHPRVLWAGISGQTNLLRDLQRDLDASLHGLGFPKDERAFTGHLTIGRFKADHHRSNNRSPESLPELLIDIMKQYQKTASTPFLVEAVHVMKSDLKPTGPIYTSLANVRLKGC